MLPPMAPTGLFPRGSPRPTTSHAERALHAALSKGLPEGWTAWHSLRVRTRTGLEGEGDFVIAIPDRGILVLEVKGGQVEVRDGHWLSNGKRLDRPPREQGHAFARTLTGALEERGLRDRPWFAVATAFPDMPFSNPPGQGDLEGVVIGQQDLPFLREALEALRDRLFDPDRRPRDGRWIPALHGLWGETWTPRLALGQRARLDETDRVALDEEQIGLLAQIADNDRMLVDGGAGTGKTLLACEVARRWASDNRDVLLVCFTDALARWLEAHTAGTRVRVSTIRGLARALLTEAQLAVDETATDFWEELPWRAAGKAVPLLSRSPTAVVVDEGQDFTLGDWSLVEACAGKLPLWVFQDRGQSFWPDRDTPTELFSARFRLTKSYRCPRALALVAEAYAGRPLDEVAFEEAVKHGQLAVVACPSESSVADKVAIEIDKLLGDGLRPSDIAVISLRGQSPPDAVIRQRMLGRHRLVRADDPDIDHHVVADTFLRFKGLERPAVIVTDLRLVQDRSDVRVHIALTRALLTARVVATREVLEKSPVFGRLA